MISKLPKKFFCSIGVDSTTINILPKVKINKRGVINLEKLKQRNLESKLDSIYIGFPDFYGRLSTIKMDPDNFIKNYEQGITLDSSVLHSDLDGIPFGESKLARQKLVLKPDTKTINEMAWLKSKSYLVMGNVYNSTQTELYPFCPRNILHKQTDEMLKLGYIVNGASELEFFLYNRKYNENFSKGLTKLKEFGSHPEDYLIQQGDRFEHIYEKFRIKLRDSGVPVESMKGEASIGQHEINLSYGDAVRMSDDVLILKSCLKCIADSYNTTITFMAKPNKDRMGSSSHLHVSLHDSHDMRNVFPGNEFKLSDEQSCSQLMMWFLGGIMKYSLDTFILFAPTINSYKRFKTSSWTPTNLNNWSVDNRLSSFRVCGMDKSLRIEYRIPGGDINQYLAYAGLIAAGSEGIKNKIVPDSSSGQVKRIPPDMPSALRLFESSEFINRTFGNEVHQHLINFYKNEIDINEKGVTRWEFNRYLDLI